MRAPRGWPIVGWAAAALAAMLGAIFAAEGTGPGALALAVRATARTSVTLFSLAFLAASLRRAWPSRATAWLLGNRRQVGVSFALSHFAHLLVLLALCGWSVGGVIDRAGIVTVLLGGVGYLFLAAMTATSFDRSAAWLGPARWKRLHTTGVYYLWLVFFLTFASRAASSLVYASLALALLAVLAFRFAGPSIVQRLRSPGAASAGAGS
ncbi:MAG TPA: hypothetical protein VFI25_06080 [Planctomycetota bacterium]|jgi:hypothetical protein|nr:hypothetical protein [Planctomycetota bacterium]